MNCKDYIVSDNAVMPGKPIIKGTRLTIEFIVKLLASGWDQKQIIENYPQLSKAHLQAVFSFILENMQDKMFINSTTEIAV